MKDVLDQDVATGDLVVCHYNEGKEEFIKKGDVYRIKNIIDKETILEEVDGKFYLKNFIKINLNHDPDTINQMADRLVALINSKPWSPTKDEIRKVLEMRVIRL